jgi:tetratricopeptide (TPR) repeat protein
MSTVLNIFISSKMVELKAERDAVFKLIPTLDYGDIKLHAWLFEEDAGASSEAIRRIYLDTLQNSALYVGIFWQEHGKWTIDEFDRATEWGLERHIFVKDVEANKRDPNLTAFLNKQGDVKRGITAKWFTGKNENQQIANLCAAVKKSLDIWVEKYRSGPRGESSACIYETSSAILERPRKLIGRDEELKTAKVFLVSGEQVLLQGFSGIGKTALAAEIAAQYTPLIWLRAGRNNETELFEALARPFNAQEAIAKESGLGKVHMMRSILAQSSIKLVVLDDAWNGQALQVVMQAVPPNIALLVTSRRRYGLDRIITIGDLDPNQSLELLAHYAKQNYLNDTNAAELCKKLGYLPFALRLAGLNLKMNQWNPYQLIIRIDNLSEDLTVPLDFIESGRETVAKLIQVSLSALDNEIRKIFLMFGAFFATQMTPEILFLYSIVSPEMIDLQLKTVRGMSPNLQCIPDKQLWSQILRHILNQINPNPIQKTLEVLYLHGLVERQPDNDVSIVSYRIHDLAYSYVKAQNSNSQHMNALQACLAYVEHYNEPLLQNFMALYPELDNLMGAVAWAFEIERYAEVEEFASKLYSESQFLIYRGFYTEAVILLNQAAESAKRVGNRHNQLHHISNLGSAISSLGQLDESINYYKQALNISCEIGDQIGEWHQLTNLGVVYNDLGLLNNAIDYYQRALKIVCDIGDQQGQISILTSLGLAYNNSGYKKKAMSCHYKALTIGREIGDRLEEGANLGYLGRIYTDLGQIKKAIKYLNQSVIIFHKLGDKRLESIFLGNLGASYELLGELEKAIYYNECALIVSREVGDRHIESDHLSNLGHAYASLDQLEKAIDFHKQALVVRREIGDRIGAANELDNLGWVYIQHTQDYLMALQCYEEERELYRDIGLHDQLAIVDHNIAQVKQGI